MSGEVLSNNATISPLVGREVPDDPIKQFFETFPSFVYDPNQRPGKQLEKLSLTCGWSPHSEAHKAAVSGLYVALFRQFDPTYQDEGELPAPVRKKGVRKAVVQLEEKHVQEPVVEAEERGAQETLGQAEEQGPRETLVQVEEPDTKKIPEESLVSLRGDPATAVDELPTAEESSKEPDQPIAGTCTEPLKDFFLQYPTFHYLPEVSAATQLQQLRRHQDWYWARGHLWTSALMQYRSALVQQFNQSYGTDENDLGAWHRVLAHVRVKKLPATVEECKSLASGIHINLVDLVDARNDPAKMVVVFRSEEALSAYTFQTKKFFPKANVFAGGLLRHLLRNILNPNAEAR